MISFVFSVKFFAHLKFGLSFRRFAFTLDLGLIGFDFVFIKKNDVKLIQEQRDLFTKQNYVLDETKRRSLQPSNIENIPLGAQISSTDPKNDTPKPRDPTKRRISDFRPTEVLPFTINHQFFGTQLMIGDIKVASNLAKKLHRLEISKDGLFIDNVPQNLNQAQIETIKATLNKNQ